MIRPSSLLVGVIAFSAERSRRYTGSLPIRIEPYPQLLLVLTGCSLIPAEFASLSNPGIADYLSTWIAPANCSGLPNVLMPYWFTALSDAISFAIPG